LVGRRQKLKSDTVAFVVSDTSPAQADAEPGLHRALGLTDEEAASIAAILGRSPNSLELAMYSVMWSEHCSYKSTRTHLSRLPTKAPWVLVGPGENAGVVDAGNGVAVALRIESHNHPSAIEPYQGAATGVGGILRDIFTMGARPIAVLDSLHFGPLDNAHGRWLLEGVVNGISGYGNAVGVPTVGGELSFDPGFAENPLVNVMCVGVMPQDRLVLASASEPGDLAVLLGSTTGRDGIGGVSILASAGFNDGEESAAKRPSVQVGDPFEEKRLIEACLALYDAGLVAGIQDLGGAGLTCATSETASRGGTGMDVDLTAVPLRQSRMTPAEVMTSESQERMLAIVRPADLDGVMAICRRWEVRSTVVGHVNASGRLRILDGFDGEVLADVPAASLHEDAPVYNRPMQPPADRAALASADPDALPAPSTDDCGSHVLAMLGDTAWVWTQYDHQLFLNTVRGPGDDAAVLRLKAPGLSTSCGLALTTDSNTRWCSLDPRRGTALVVAEAALNLACQGARALAVVNCLNFGNPEHPEVMWQLSEAIDGMSEACVGLGLPVVGGNVSLYNESDGRDIRPTPVIGMVGLIESLDRRPPGVGLVDGGRIVLIGGLRAGSLAGSRWAADVHGELGGQLPDLDLDHHAAVCELVRQLVADGLVAGIHDVADGGLAVALTEMAVRSSVGFKVSEIGHGSLFSESPSRVVACVVGRHVAQLVARAGAAGVEIIGLGDAGGDALEVEGRFRLSLAEASRQWRHALPEAVSGSATEPVRK
jgi:phosphoribosylformylglycinamidine synthase II